MSAQSPREPHSHDGNADRRPEHDCAEVQASLWRYVDRELSGREMAKISEVLRCCEACRQVHDERARELRVCRVTLADVPFGGESFVEKFHQRFEDEGLAKVRHDREPGLLRRLFSFRSRSDSFPTLSRHAVDSRGPDSFDGLVDLPRTTPQRRRRMVAVAALLLLIPTIVGVGVYLSGRRPHDLGTYHVVRVTGTNGDGGAVAIARRGSDEFILRADSDGIFRSQTVFNVATGSRLDLRLGAAPSSSKAVAEISIFGPAEFHTLDSSVEEFIGYLVSGKLEASVTQREPDDGESFKIRTPRHGIKVIGTEFTLEARGDVSRLRVAHGQVAFGVWGGAAAEVYEETVVSDGEELVLPVGAAFADDRSEGANDTDSEISSSTAGSTTSAAGSASSDSTVAAEGSDSSQAKSVPGDTVSGKSDADPGRVDSNSSTEGGAKIDSHTLENLDKPFNGKAPEKKSGNDSPGNVPPVVPPEDEDD